MKTEKQMAAAAADFAARWEGKGMTLSFEDVKHYGRIIYVLQQTERLMGDIDNLMKE
jgi:uncharacterized membrane protein YccC